VPRVFRLREIKMRAKTSTWSLVGRFRYGCTNSCIFERYQHITREMQPKLHSVESYEGSVLRSWYHFGTTVFLVVPVAFFGVP
jgi:hypothetical protein